MRSHTVLVLALVTAAPLVSLPAQAQKRSRIASPARKGIFGGGLRRVHRNTARPPRAADQQTYRFPLVPVMGYGAGPNGSVGGVHVGAVTVETRPWARTLSAFDRRVLQIGNPFSPFTYFSRVPVVTAVGYEWRNKLFWHATDHHTVRASGKVDQSGQSSARLFRAGGPDD